MLPDYPELKDDLRAILDRYMKNRVRYHSGPINEVRRSRLFEGRGSSILRPTGEEEKTELVQMSAEFSVTAAEIPTMTLDTLLERLDKAAEELARQQSQHFYTVLSEATDRTGNVVDAKGRPFSAEGVLAVLEKIGMNFDQAGKAEEITVVLPPALMPAARKAIEDLKNDEALQKRHAEIMRRKKEEWDAREAGRNLVG